MSEENPAVTSDSVRVAVWLGEAGADLTVPSRLPVAALIPELHALLCDAVAPGLAPPRWLRTPTGPPLDPATGLVDNGIGDGATLLLCTAPAAPDPEPLDAAAALAEAARRGLRPWSGAAARCAAGCAAVWGAGLAGGLALPAEAGAPWGSPSRLLLAGAAAGTAAVLSRRLCTGSPMVFSMLAAAAGPVWLAALVATVLPVRPAAVGALTVLAALVGLSAAARLALRLGDPDGAADRLTALTAGTAAAAALGALLAQLVPTGPTVALGVAAAAVLAARVPPEPDALRRAALLAGAAGCVSAAAIGLARCWPGHGGWPACGTLGAAVGLAALGRLRPAGADTPRRWPPPLAALALALAVPLTVWTLGLPGWPR